MPRAGLPPSVCTDCGRSFVRKFDLNRHAQTHDPNARRFACASPGCDYSSLQKSNLKTHYSSKHLGRRPHQCSVNGCPRSYGDGSSVLRHEKKDHKFYRNELKPYARPSSKKMDAHQLNDSVFIEEAARTPEPTPSLSEPSSVSVVASPTLPPVPTTPSASSSVTFGAQTCPEIQPVAEFPHEMALDLFAKADVMQSIPALTLPFPFNPGSDDTLQEFLMLQDLLDLQVPRFEDFALVSDQFTLGLWAQWPSFALPYDVRFSDAIPFA